MMTAIIVIAASHAGITGLLLLALGIQSIVQMFCPKKIAQRKDAIVWLNQKNGDFDERP